MFLRNRLLGAAILRAPDDAAASGPMTVDQAVAAIQAAPEAAADDAPAAVEPDAGEADAPEDVDAGETGPETEAGDADDALDTEAEAGEDSQPGEPELSPIDPPHFWSAEDKAAFAELPRHLQEKVATYEKGRVDASNRAVEEAAEARKAAEAARVAAEREAAATAELKGKVDAEIERASQVFASRWSDDINWANVLTQLTEQCTAQYGPEHGPSEATRQFLLLKEQHAAETQELQRLQAAKHDLAEREARDAKERDAAARNAFVAREIERLRTIEPELTDPAKGPERYQKLVKFLGDNGLPPEQLQDADAASISIAYRAMKYEESRAAAAKVAAAPAKRPNPTPAPPSLRPSAAQPAAPPAQRAATEARNRFAQKPTTENAIAAILALQKG
jgi:hypothetical protein